MNPGNENKKCHVIKEIIVCINNKFVRVIDYSVNGNEQKNITAL